MEDNPEKLNKSLEVEDADKNTNNDTAECIPGKPTNGSPQTQSSNNSSMQLSLGEDLTSMQLNYQSTPETVNFARLTRLLLDVSPDVMRGILRHCLGHAEKSLTEALDNNRHELEVSKLHPNERKLLFFTRQPNVSIYSLIDFSLMYRIARIIPKCRSQIEPNEEEATRKWGKAPKPNDRSLLASIERLRHARNTFIAHVPNTNLNRKDFIHKWNEVREPIMDIERLLGWGERYTAAITTLLTAPLDPEMVRLSYELLQKEQQIQKMKESGGKCVSIYKIHLFMYIPLVQFLSPTFRRKRGYLINSNFLPSSRFLS